jgi:hypothetical protein
MSRFWSLFSLYHVPQFHVSTVVPRSTLHHWSTPHRCHPTYTIHSHIQYQLSSILQFFLHTRCFPTATIKDKLPMSSNHLILCMLDEVLRPLDSQLIGCPAVVADSKYSVLWDRLFFIPSRQVIFAGKDGKRWNFPASSVGSLNQSYPLTIARLDRLWPVSSI